MTICIAEKLRTQAGLTNEDPQRPSLDDYESIYDTEIDASPSAAMTEGTDAPTEDAFDGYSALKDRIAAVHEPPVYCALIVSE